MARRVIHYSDIGNYYSYFREHNTRPKTLCSREMTANYRYTEVMDNVTCTRCKAKLVKQNMMPGQVNGATLRITNVSDIGACGDEKVDLYLQRLGIG